MIKNMMNPLSVDAIVERAELFTHDNAQALATELQALSKGGALVPDGKLSELVGKLMLIRPDNTLQLAIAMVSNECVKLVAAQGKADVPH